MYTAGPRLLEKVGLLLFLFKMPPPFVDTPKLHKKGGDVVHVPKGIVILYLAVLLCRALYMGMYVSLYVYVCIYT